jgi:biopolymer transport protein ExbD
MSSGKPGEINVTPMIDVLLVLIIIFMMIAPDKSTGLDAQVPQLSNGQGAGREIVVRVAEDRSVTINTQPIGWSDLDARIRDISVKRPDAVLFVSAARQTEFQDVARVIDLARGAGIRHIGFMPKQH